MCKSCGEFVCCCCSCTASLLLTIVVTLLITAIIVVLCVYYGVYQPSDPELSHKINNTIDYVKDKLG